MYDDRPLYAMTGNERAGFLKRVNPIDGQYGVSPETTSVCRRILPFHEERVTLVRVLDTGWPIPNLSVYYLSHKTDLYRLNGTSPPIHQVNERARIRLTEENVRDYLRFFFWFVRAEKGPFVLVERLPALPPDLDERSRAVLEEAIHPLVCERRDDQDGFMCGAAVWHSGKLFSVMIEVYPNGMVAMTEDEEIATGFPVGEIEPIA